MKRRMQVLMTIFLVILLITTTACTTQVKDDEVSSELGDDIDSLEDLDSSVQDVEDPIDDEDLDLE